MLLSALIQQESGVSPESIMLLRHSASRAGRLAEFGATVDEYTAVQDEGGKYDYLHPGKEPIRVVVVLVGDEVHAVYRVRGILRKGLREDVGSAAYSNFSKVFGKPNTPSVLFDLERIESGATGKPVHGWSAPIVSVLRSNAPMFGEIEVDALPRVQAAPLPMLQEDRRRALADAVDRSLDSGRAARLARLATAPRLPRRVQVLADEFDRNPDVIAEVLFEAGGICGGCRQPAPFARARDGSPYLEVHHRVPLSRGGEDTVENSVALCPNCHRRQHHGLPDTGSPPQHQTTAGRDRRDGSRETRTGNAPMDGNRG